MFSKFLFGVQNSPQRTICVALAVVLTLIGLIVIPVLGADTENGPQGVALGVAFALLGLASIAVISRVFAAHDEKVETSAQLGRLKADYNVKGVVVDAVNDPNSEWSKVNGKIDGAAIQASVDQVRPDHT